ncbi:MAG: autotransporter domain-containing protein [Phycisphaerales bacterium]|nr:autotransporter domain-containing protein [Phycisphaerales bacterium]
MTVESNSPPAPAVQNLIPTRRRRAKLLAATAAAITSIAGLPLAATAANLAPPLVDVNFTTGSTYQASGPGVVGSGSDFWNNITVPGGGSSTSFISASNISLNTVANSSSGYSLSYATNHGAGSNAAGTFDTGLMHDYLTANAGTTASYNNVTISGLAPNTVYDLYAYVASFDGSNQTRATTVFAGSQSANASGNGSSASSFIQGTNYVLLTPISDNTGSITITQVLQTGASEADFNGLQIQSANVTFTQTTHNSNGTATNFWSNGGNWNTGTPAGSLNVAIIPASGSGSYYNADLNGTSQTVLALNLGAGSNIYNSGSAAESLIIDPVNTNYGSNIAGNIGSTTGTLPGGSGGAGGGGGSINLTIDGATNNTISGQLFGNLSLTINGGVNTLSNTNTYTGATTINGGTTVSRLSLTGSGSIADSSGVTISNNGIFDISGTTSGATIQSLISGSFTSSVTLGNQTLTINNGGGFDGIISGAGGGLTLAGGTLSLIGGNTYTGATNITGGTLSLVGSGSIADSSGLTVGPRGAFSLYFSSIAPCDLASLSGAGSVILGSNTLTLTSAAGTFSGVVSGLGGLTIASGTETLSGNNTYAGDTTINAGATLNITGGIYTGGTLGNLAADGTVNIGPSSIVSLDQLTGTGLLNINGVTSQINVYGTTTGSGGGVSSNFGGTLTGNGTLVASNCSVALTGAVGTFSGNLQATNGGRMNIAGTGTLSSGVVLQVENNSIVSIGYAQLGAAGVFFTGNSTGGSLNITGGNQTATLSGNITLNDSAGSSVNAIDAAINTSTLTIAGAINSDNLNSAPGGGNTLILQNGNFVVTSQQNSTHFVGAGTLQIGNGIAATNVAFAGSQTLPGASVNLALNNGTFQFDAANINVNNQLNVDAAGGTLDINGQTGSELSGSMVSTGPLTLQNSAATGGTIILADDNTGSGSTVVNSGLTVNFTNANAFGSGEILLAANGDRLQYGADGINLANAIGLGRSAIIDTNNHSNLELTGSLNGPRLFTLTLENSAVSGTVAPGTGGSLSINSDNISYLGNTTITSSGFTTSFTQNSAFGPTGTVTLANTNDTLQFNQNNLNETNPLDLASTGGTLDIQGNAATWSGTISGNDLNVINTGAANSLTLSAGNLYSGGTTIGSSVALIAANASALGTGAVVINPGATLETPIAATGGASGSNLTLNTGNFTQGSGAMLSLALSGTPASSQYDSINVNGSANLAGTLRVLVQPAATPALGHQESYAIIKTSSGIVGNFSTVSLAAGSPTGLLVTSNIVGNDYELNLLNGFGFTTTLTAPTPTQLAVANYLDTIGNSGAASAGTLSLLQTLTGLTTSQLSTALNELAPTAYANIPATLLNNSIFTAQALNGQIAGQFAGGGVNTAGLTLLKTDDTDPFGMSLAAAMQSNSTLNNATSSIVSLDDAAPTAMPGGRVPVPPSRSSRHDAWGGFVAGEAVLGSQPTDTSGQNYFTGGVLSGVDYRFAKSLIVGLSFNYSYTNAHIDNVGSVLTDNSYAPGVFAGYRKGGFYADGSADYTYTRFSVHRNVTIGGSTTTATGKPHANQQDVNVLAGYNFPLLAGFKAGPAVGLDYTHIDVSSYTETGSPADLAVSGNAIDSLRSLLGGQAEYTLNIPHVPLPLTITANAFWQHEFLNNSHGITAALAGAGGSFITNVPNPGRDSALLGAGLNGKLCRYANVFANYQAQIGPKNQHSQSIMVGLAIKF